MKYLISLMILIFLLHGCKEKSVIPVEKGKYPVIEKVISGSKWNINSQRQYRIEVIVSDPQGVSNLDTTLSVTVIEKNSGATVRNDSLYDDGSQYHVSGDVIAKDGIFSNLYSVNDIDSSAENGKEYVFRFLVSDKEGHESEIVDFDVKFLFDRLPEVRTILSAPDSLLNGDQNKKFRIAVFDSDGIEDIARAYMTGHASESGQPIFEYPLFNDGTHGDQAASDSIFTTIIDSSFAAGREERLYYLKYYVVDSLEEKNNNVPVTTLYLENGPARIDSILMPDTIARPEDKLTFQIEVFTYDPQGPADIEAVFFQTIKPDGSYSGFGSSGSFFDLQDTGEAFYGDEVANDGVFSKKVQLEKKNDPGTYKFLFYLRPKIGQDLGPVIDSIIVQ